MEANFKLQNLALHLHGNNVLDGTVLSMLLDVPRLRRQMHSQLPFGHYEHVTFKEMKNSECAVEFRVEKDGIYTVVHTFRL